MEDVKQPLEAGMMCKEYLDQRLRCIIPITSDNTGLYVITDINESIQGSSGIMPTTKKGKLQVRYAKLMGLNGSILYSL